MEKVLNTLFLFYTTSVRYREAHTDSTKLYSGLQLHDISGRSNTGHIIQAHQPTLCILETITYTVFLVMTTNTRQASFTTTDFYSLRHVLALGKHGLVIGATAHATTMVSIHVFVGYMYE